MERKDLALPVMEVDHKMKDAVQSFDQNIKILNNFDEKQNYNKYSIEE